MRSLSQYLKEQTQELDYIDESILQHIAISYKHNCKNHIVLEKYGIYDGCEELAQHIADHVIKNGADNQYEFTKDDLKEFNNVFFKKIFVDVDTSDDRGAEYNDGLSEVGDDGFFEKVYIDVFIYEEHIKKELKESLMHELTHAYNDYVMKVKKNPNYTKTMRSLMYAKISNEDPVNPSDKLVKKAMYLLLGYEKNAFFAEIKGEFESSGRKIHNPHDALAALKDTKIYKSYKSLCNDIELYFKGELSDEFVKEFENSYYELTKRKETANQIFKKLRDRAKKALKKLDAQLPKLCIEFLK